MKSQDSISIIIPTYKQTSTLIRAIESIYACSHQNFEIIIINNAQNNLEKTLQTKFKKLKNIIFIQNKSNQYFAKSINQGIKRSKGKYILIFNDDAFLEKNSLELMLDTIKKSSQIAAVCPKILKYPSKAIDSLGCSQDIFGFSYKQISKFHQDKFFYFAIGLYRKDILIKLKSYDPKFIIFWEDVDLCWRIWLSGNTISYQPKAIVHHQVSQSTSQLSSSFSSFHIRKNRIRGLIKNYSFVFLIFILPLSLFLHLLLASYESFSQKNIDPIRATIKAILWNFKNLKSTFRQRLFVQKNIRKVPDIQILKKMILFPRFSQTS